MAADYDFFRDSARECRMLARRTRNERVRVQLLLWGREFDAMATERQPSRLEHELREAAD